MPRKRKSSTFSFRVADCEGYVTVGEFPDGRPGEVFISVSKQGSTLAGIMDAFAISVSMGLQHGVPLATFVRHFTNMRFEPAGMTDDPELRFAASLVDYIFRRLAVEYMSPAERMDAGHPDRERTHAAHAPRGRRGGPSWTSRSVRIDDRTGAAGGPARLGGPGCRPRTGLGAGLGSATGSATGSVPSLGSRPAQPAPGQLRLRGQRREWRSPWPATPPIATNAASRCSGPGAVLPARHAGQRAAALSLNGHAMSLGSMPADVILGEDGPVFIDVNLRLVEPQDGFRG